MRTTKTTASLLSLAVGLALASAAHAGLQDTPPGQNTIAQDQQQAPTTDPLDTVDEPLDTVTHPMDPLSAQASDDASTEEQAATAEPLAPVDDMDEPGYETETIVEAGGSTAASAGPGEFASLDRNDDGYLDQDELQGTDAATVLARFDVDKDQRLNGYEYDSLTSSRFASLDSNVDNFLDETEASAFAALGTSFTSVDLDGDGRVSEVEHQAFLDSGAWASERDRYAFRYLDLDGDGFVSRTEAAQFTDFAAEFDVMDEDADGLVDSSQYDMFMNDWDQDSLVYDTDDQ